MATAGLEQLLAWTPEATAATLAGITERIAREAAELGLALPAHYAHMLVHGTLHAQGYDHERVRDARVMEARETALMRTLGFNDPYAA